MLASSLVAQCGGTPSFGPLCERLPPDTSTRQQGVSRRQQAISPPTTANVKSLVKCFELYSQDGHIMYCVMRHSDRSKTSTSRLYVTCPSSDLCRMFKLFGSRVSPITTTNDKLCTKVVCFTKTTNTPPSKAVFPKKIHTMTII